MVVSAEPLGTMEPVEDTPRLWAKFLRSRQDIAQHRAGLEARWPSRFLNFRRDSSLSGGGLLDSGRLFAHGRSLAPLVKRGASG